MIARVAFGTVVFATAAFSFAAVRESIRIARASGSLRVRMDQADRRRIEEYFSIEHTIGRFSRLYEQLLANPGAAQ